MCWFVRFALFLFPELDRHIYVSIFFFFLSFFQTLKHSPTESRASRRNPARSSRVRSGRTRAGGAASPGPCRSRLCARSCSPRSSCVKWVAELISLSLRRIEVCFTSLSRSQLCKCVQFAARPRQQQQKKRVIRRQNAGRQGWRRQTCGFRDEL